MPERPLLVFPLPTEISRYKLQSGPGKAFIKPEKNQQIARVEPQFQVLENAFMSRRIQLQSDVTGTEPEMVLVFETRGPINDFLGALKGFPELQWLGDLEREFEPDEQFYYDGDESKPIRGKVFFVMSNYQGLRQLKSLWDNYYVTGAKFQRGTTKWRDLFDLLFEIRFWGFRDRIDETGIMEDWRYRVEANQERMPFEIELWYRKNEVSRAAARNKIIELIEEFDGQLLKECSIGEINYHSLLVEAPVRIFDNLSEETEISFFKTSEIMHLRPVGQCAIKIADEPGLEDEIQAEVPEINLAPVVALLDGFPIQNHILLQGRLVIDDPDNFSEDNPAQFRKHGTGMASLVVRGDLNGNEPPLRSSVYFRPIMKYSNPYEQIPEDELAIDLIHRSVRRMFEPTEGAVANTVKVINLSIGDPIRIYDNTISPLAKLIDWLAFKYNVLFIVSAGNCSDNISFGGNVDEILTNPQNLERESINFFYRNIRHRKIISPAESINSLTVGACHADLSVGFQLGRLINVYERPQLPSPISRLGLGHRRSIKPEVLMPGGKVLFSEPLATPELRVNNSIRAPGQKVAYPMLNDGPTGTAYTKGTSNSTALLSRAAAKLYETLHESQDIPPILMNGYFPVVAKSLLVHGASWDEEAMETIIDSIPGFEGNEKDLVSRFLGYGNVSTERILECTEKRVTLVGFGELGPEEAHLFKLPLPLSISGPLMWKRLTVTLAWFSSINPTNQIYRNSKLWFDFPGKQHEEILSLSRKFYDNDTVNRGTVQHEIFEANRASAFVDGTTLSIRVNCKADASKSVQSVRYGLEIPPKLTTSFRGNVTTKS